MSRRTAEASKAIRIAWEKEQQRVLEGKGTRDWTPEQQQSIIDKGKAYDEEGRAFEGQHMKSAEKYPECQGDYNNIQFLTREEHLAAHDGDWRNPTNWYYDPITGQKTDFGDGPVIPCVVIDLSYPICIQVLATKNDDSNPVSDKTNVYQNNIEKSNLGEYTKGTYRDSKNEEHDLNEAETAEIICPDSTEDTFAAHKESFESAYTDETYNSEVGPIIDFEDSANSIEKPSLLQSFKRKAGAIVGAIWKDIKSRPIEYISGGLELASILLESNGNHNNSKGSDSNSSNSLSPKVSPKSSSKLSESVTGAQVTTSEPILDASAQATESIPIDLTQSNRASPIEHEVAGYDRMQNGKIVHVKPYTRGGKKND